MDYNSNCGITSLALSCAGYLPSYGATAAWFGRATPAPAIEALPGFLEEMRTFALGDYDAAVRAWLGTFAAVPAPVLDRLAATTGLPRSAWATSPNRGPHYYRVNLTPGTLHGRYDTRV